MYTPVPLSMPPGIVRNGSKKSVAGRYYDASLVHFLNGFARRWGGWDSFVSTLLDTPCRGALAWAALDGSRYVAFGTADKLWVVNNSTLYDITPSGLGAGNVDGVGSTAIGEYGVGDGTWGGYETPYDGINIRPSVWSLAKWGEDLLAVRRGSTLYHWDTSVGTGTAAAAVSGAPSRCLGIIVTEDRHAVVLGAHDGTSPDDVRLQWPDRETLTVWTPSATVTAGDLRLEFGNEIMCAQPCTDGHLILTDISAFKWEYIGGQDIFSKRRVMGGQGSIGPLAAIEYDGEVYWMGQDRFFNYNGVINEIPCDIQDYVFKDLNRAQAFKICCGTNREFGEIMWFYPSNLSLENDRYVSMQRNGNQVIWNKGELARTFWLDENVLTQKPIATDPDGNILVHEIGTTDQDGNAISYYLETGDLNITPEGTISGVENHMTIRKIVPDFNQLDSGTHQVTIKRKDYPHASETTKGPYSFDATKKKFSPRARGPLMAFRYSGDAYFEMGEVMGYVANGGGR